MVLVRPWSDLAHRTPRAALLERARLLMARLVLRKLQVFATARVNYVLVVSVAGDQVFLEALGEGLEDKRLPQLLVFLDGVEVVLFFHLAIAELWLHEFFILDASDHVAD